MSTSKKAVFLGLAGAVAMFLALSFGLIPSASAAELYAQTADDTAYNFFNTVNYGVLKLDNGKTHFPDYPISATLNEINLELSKNFSTDKTYNLTLNISDSTKTNICSYSWLYRNINDLPANKTIKNFSLVAADSYTKIRADQNYTSCTSSSVTLADGFIQINLSQNATTASTSLLYYGSTSPVYTPSGFGLHAVDAGDVIISQMPYIIFGTVVPPTPTISITAPANSSSSSELNWLAQNWVFSASNFITSHLYDVWVCYGTTTGAGCFDYDYGNGYSGVALKYSMTHPPGWTATGGTDEIQMLKRELLPIGTYFARAFVIDLSSPFELLASSSEVTFDVVSSLPGAPPPPPPPPSITCNSLDFVCQFQQWFSTQIQAISTYLFVPSGDSLDQWKTLWSPIKTKAPIGYITSLISSFGALSASGAPAFTLASMSSLSSLITPLDFVLGVILWVFIAFWLFRRIAKMEL
jgi:hypothetical protein